MRLISFILSSLVFVPMFAFAQNNNKLSKELNEISGIEIYQDSIFFAINDGGNEDIIYVLSKNYKLLKRVKIEKFKNVDWEDLTMDNEFLYIADIGNNSNKRKNIKIARIKIQDLLKEDKVIPEIMNISYKQQVQFPPSTDNLYYDAETLISDGNSLFIFTKNRTKPFDGISLVYKFEFLVNQDVCLNNPLQICFGKNSWLIDSFTGGAFHKDVFYLLTYNKILALTFDENRFILINHKTFSFLKQREGICISDNEEIYVANENHKWLGEQKIQKIIWRH